MLLAAAMFAAAPMAFAQDCAARLVPPAQGAGAKRAVTIDDLVGLRDFGPANDVPWSDPVFSLSPDGRQIALLLRRADPDANRYCIGLLVYRFDTGAVRVLDTGGDLILSTVDFRGFADWPTGAVVGGTPAWSPDGRSIAWLRRDARVTRLWRVEADGTGARAVTKEPLDVRRFAWGPDNSLVYQVRPALETAQRTIEKEGLSGELYDERFWPMAETSPYPKANLPYETRILDAGGNVRVATDEERKALGPDPDPRQPPGAIRTATSKSGELAWLRPIDPKRFLSPIRLEVATGGKTQACTDTACSSDISGMWWSRPGELLFLRDWASPGGGMLELYRWHPGSRPVSLYRTTAALHGCQLRGTELICGEESASQPRRIVALDPARGRLRVLLDPNPEFGSIALGAVRRLDARAADGTPTFADLALPPDHRPGQRHPLVIVQYTSRGFLRGGTGDEYPVHALAARGYAVLSFQRPRPPALDFTASALNDYQRHNVTDWADRRRVFSALDAAIDRAVATGTVDPERIGITGLSDGAATVQWALLNSNRFKAAVVSGCCEDPSTVNFVGGLAYRNDVRQWGYPPPGPGDADFWARYSIARNAKRMDTPLLVQLADRQYRMALDTVTSLKEAGKPVEMYVFPDEYHVKWQPAHRRAIYARVLDWFDFWLCGRENPGSGRSEEYRRWEALRAAASTPAAQPGLDRGKP